jgi:hypothetical protein
MATNMEAIWAALKDRLEAYTDEAFTTIARSAKSGWGIEEHPVLQIIEGDETPSGDDADLPALWTVSGILGIRAKSNGEEPPWSQLNDLIWRVKTALERRPDDDDHQDNQGAAQHWTNLGLSGVSLSVGRIEKAVGEAQGEAWAKVEITLTVF